MNFKGMARLTLFLVAGAFLFGLASVSRAAPVTYFWLFDETGTNGDGNFDFVNDRVFPELPDGELDILVRQDGSIIDVERSTIKFSFADGGLPQLVTSAIQTATAPTCNSVSEPFIPGCLDTLAPDEVRFQHYFIPIEEWPLNLSSTDILSASLELVGTGLDFNDSDLRIRWDWRDIEGTPTLVVDVSTVNEPATWSLLLVGTLALLRRRRSAKPRGRYCAERTPGSILRPTR